MNADLEQDNLTRATNAKLGHEYVNVQDTNILDFNQLRGERENEISESRKYPDRKLSRENYQ